MEFDETGVATHVVNVPDQQLVSKLARVALPGQTPIGSRLPQEIKIEYLRLRDRGTGYQFAELYLSPEAFVFKNHGARDHDFQIRPADIVGVSRAGILGRDSGEPDPNCVEETLHFRQKTNAGRSITFKIKPSDLLLLVAYLQQNHPAALGNEHRHD